MLNLVEYAAGNNDLTTIRSRGRLQRPFTRVHVLFQKANDKFREEESLLVSKVTKIESEMTAALKATKGLSVHKLQGSLEKARLALVVVRKA